MIDELDGLQFPIPATDNKPAAPVTYTDDGLNIVTPSAPVAKTSNQLALVCEHGARPGERYVIIPGRALIGRSDPVAGIAPDIDLTEQESEVTTVSRRHAEIAYTGDGYTLTDLGSANGTYVNGTKLAPGEAILLRPGTRVKVGDIVFVTTLI